VSGLIDQHRDRHSEPHHDPDGPLHITVIAKTPVPGRVKTRLCPPCTPDEAAEIAAAALADTFEAVDRAAAQWSDTGGEPPVRRVILLDGPPAAWFPSHFDIVAQCDGDLGTRLAHGFDTLGSGIIVAMDSPYAAVHAVAALASLAGGRDAIGPTDDGGYWGIALRASPRAVLDSIFDGVPMSTPSTRRDQMMRLSELGRSFDVLASGRDIDTFDDVVDLADSDSVGRTATVARRLVDAVTLRHRDVDLDVPQ
jgi:uncharacterized protein